MQILLIIAFLTSTFSAFTQSKSEILQEIRDEYRKINSDTSLRIIRLENEEFLKNATDGGGELVGYFKNDAVQKIYQWIGLSNGNEVKEFYFKDGQLIFVHERFNSFVFNEKTEQLDRTRTKMSFEGRYNFSNYELVEYVTTGHNRFEDDTIDPEVTLLNEARYNLELLNRKK